MCHLFFPGCMKSMLLMLPECGHMNMFEKPDEVNAAVRAFVGKL